MSCWLDEPPVITPDKRMNRSPKPKTGTSLTGRISRIPGGLFLLVLLVLETVATAQGIPQPPDTWREKYANAPDFKALAISRPVGDGALIVRFSRKYDTARTAYEAARAYCEQARQKLDRPDRYTPCQVIGLGERNIGAQPPSGRVFETYQNTILEQLRKKLAQTNNRDTRTTLTTILQKTGRYEDSESLLIGLAEKGEDLAQNALAYHWAELKKNLPKAVRFANAAIRQQPDFFSFHDTKGLVLLRLGRLKAAVKEAEKAVALKAHPIALDHLGDIYWITGQKDLARKRWKEAIANSIDILFKKRVRLKIGTGLIGDPVFE